MRAFPAIASSLLALASSVYAGYQPAKIYGVNLGSWLVLESWMLPAEWVAMGGQLCSNCSTCIATEFSYVEAYPNTADAAFDKHWTTWFNQTDVQKLMSLGINTVRIPLGYWIVEPLVDRQTEFYPRGGMLRLKEGLRMLNQAGIQVILDHHALPGVQTPGQMFTGSCSYNVEFYTQYNYHRALIWTAVMTAFSHLDPDFASVFAIEAVNEPIMDASQTPNYGIFQQHFVEVVRAVEYALTVAPNMSNAPFNANTATCRPATSTNYTAALLSMAANSSLDPEVASVLKDSAPVLFDMTQLYGNVNSLAIPITNGVSPLTTNFMDVNWQYNNPSNPAAAANGPQAYDNHLYYSFGGVASPDEQSYMQSICNLQRIQADAALGDSPLWFGEWGLSTQFTATDQFLSMWADAQKLAYSKGSGWIFWNFKVEESIAANNLSRQWSYFEGVKLGYLTMDPSLYNNMSVCDPYTNPTNSTL